MGDKERQAEEIIKEIASRINNHSEEIKGWDNVLQIVFKDIGVVYWIKISTDGTVEAINRSLKKKEGIATINSTVISFQRVLDGKSSPILAVMSGQIQIEGAIETFMRFKSVLA